MASNSLFRVDHPSSFICQLLILIAILLFVRVSGVNGAQSKAWPLSYEFGDSEQKCEGLKLSWRKQKSLKNTMGKDFLLRNSSEESLFSKKVLMVYDFKLKRSV